MRFRSLTRRRKEALPFRLVTVATPMKIIIVAPLGESIESRNRLAQSRWEIRRKRHIAYHLRERAEPIGDFSRKIAPIRPSDHVRRLLGNFRDRIGSAEDVDASLVEYHEQNVVRVVHRQRIVDKMHFGAIVIVALLVDNSVTVPVNKDHRVTGGDEDALRKYSIFR